MTEQITGVVDNGGLAVADFPFYKGPVGLRTRAGSDLIEVAYRGDVPVARLPAAGQLTTAGQPDAEAVEILTLERSAKSRNMMVAVVRVVS